MHWVNSIVFLLFLSSGFADGNFVLKERLDVRCQNDVNSRSTNSHCIVRPTGVQSVQRGGHSEMTAKKYTKFKSLIVQSIALILQCSVVAFGKFGATKLLYLILCPLLVFSELGLVLLPGGRLKKSFENVHAFSLVSVLVIWSGSSVQKARSLSLPGPVHVPKSLGFQSLCIWLITLCLPSILAWKKAMIIVSSWICLEMIDLNGFIRGASLKSEEQFRVGLIYLTLAAIFSHLTCMKLPRKVTATVSAPTSLTESTNSTAEVPAMSLVVEEPRDIHFYPNDTISTASD